jgi:hypothetical protein
MDDLREFIQSEIISYRDELMYDPDTEDDDEITYLKKQEELNVAYRGDAFLGFCQYFWTLEYGPSKPLLGFEGHGRERVSEPGMYATGFKLAHDMDVLAGFNERPLLSHVISQIHTMMHSSLLGSEEKIDIS